MDKDEALKLALEALNTVMWHGGGSCWEVDPDKIEQAIAVIKEALAQPAQEPLDDVRGFLAARLNCWHRLTEKESDELVALFEVKPPQRHWVGLTDEEINNLWDEWEDAIRLDHDSWAKIIEASLKEKNT